MWTPSTQSSRRTSSFSLRAGVALLVAAVMLTSCAPVYGQYGNRSGSGSHVGYRAERQVYDSGYQDGYRRGRDDARDGDRFDPRGQREYRHADRGRYRSTEARRVYRQGFEQGYEEGYRDARARRHQRRR